MFLKLAEAGDASACGMVATMYFDGEGVAFDFDESVKWDLRAIELGDTTSLSNLAISYRNTGNAREARKWFEKAVATGDGEAALDLAKLLHVSDFEIDNVRRLLKMAVESDHMTPAGLEEAEAMLAALDTERTKSGS
ncbi:MAG TPA: tetratricopeptide repeat protein [Aestuariivirga sp.]|nr:tetratricopeptide repeat protein [Aestuariivirga sp.]